MEEVFKDIPGYEGYYQVSNLGRVKSLERVRLARGGKPVKFKEKMKVPQMGRSGYHQVALFKNSKQWIVSIHRLVAQSFLGLDLSNKNCHVDHIDENKLNNIVSNLDLVSPRENSNRYVINNKNSDFPLGVTISHGKYQARIWINGKSNYLGKFNTSDDASIAYQDALKRLR